jgi:CO/xanthine dehydrogenase Mo-binding subunit
MIKPSRFGLKNLNMHPGYTVGYGSKDNNIFVFYAAVAALYGAGVPIRLANDRYEQFQSGIKRHPFDIRYQLAVDKNDNSFKIFRADMSVDGGGRINYSPSVAAVGPRRRSRSTTCRRTTCRSPPTTPVASRPAPCAATAPCRAWPRPR